MKFLPNLDVPLEVIVGRETVDQLKNKLAQLLQWKTDSHYHNLLPLTSLPLSLLGYRYGSTDHVRQSQAPSGTLGWPEYGEHYHQ